MRVADESVPNEVCLHQLLMNVLQLGLRVSNDSLIFTTILLLLLSLTYNPDGRSLKHLDNVSVRSVEIEHPGRRQEQKMPLSADANVFFFIVGKRKLMTL